LAVTVFIRYQLDPFKRAMFEEYAGRWLTIDAAAISSATGCRMKAPTTSRSR
jgi:hypothetical protein